MIGIVSSVHDTAGTNIHDRILELVDFERTDTFEGHPVHRGEGITLVRTERELLHADHLDEHFTVDSWIFASKHKAISGTPSLTTHSPGNWTSEVRYGGSPEELSVAEPRLIKAALQALKARRDATGIKYEVTLEVTHHGPTAMDSPVVFVEIGSGPEQWSDPLAVDVIARAILDTVAFKPPDSWVPCVGFGGGHYPPRFTDIMLSTHYAVGHIMPKYVTDTVDITRMVRTARERNGPTELAIIDWKGLTSSVRGAVLEAIDGLGLGFIKAREAARSANEPGHLPKY
ncbi:MAG: D-aminoacyl-tRNA deacylase [Candidatus Undinarchaeales archaeon]|jgi:D-aminoacyl-tRNA deacylase|nr:D-aminoacyl-tRNA deacylase [Candidatus Undinarchaeales archaeon]MDP7491452.1 D-aminoacyl-tRNA deacylase [Candidatus Undinarchaeales archaeon]